MDEFVAGFIEEVRELLLQLEDDLIGLEENPEHTEIIHNIFRVMHTLKGSAGMVGFKNIQDLTHEFEGLYVHIRDGELQVTSEIIDMTLQCKDLILTMVNGEDGGSAGKLLTERVRKVAAADAPVRDEAKPVKAAVADVRKRAVFVVFFYPEKEIFERGLDPDKAILELQTLGDVKVILHEKKKSWEEQKRDKICQTAWEVYISTTRSIAEVEEAFMFYDQDEFQLFELHAESRNTDPALLKLLKRFHGNKVDLAAHLQEQTASFTLEDSMPDKSAIKVEKETPREAPASVMPRYELDSTINVSSHKLDELMNLVSELVTTTAELEASVTGFKDTKLSNAVESIEKLTKKFRNNALDLRLVPVGTLLTKFKRQVRDLSKELHKKVNLIIEGQDIEIDKSILKSIESPLQHIIRNSIDHGIEPEQERLSKGKPADGLLKITAFHSGASVIIQVQDDGKGIDLDRVQECAVKRGLIQANQAVTKHELINLILEPGFSTSENVSMVSGRGVGMDVVKKELGAVGGSLEIFTERDLGTSIIMKLPTTLTIIDTLHVNVGETQILIPVMDIEYCFREANDTLFHKDNRYITFKNHPIPLISLREKFKYPDAEQADQMVIVINKFEQKYAVTADQIMGEHQAVIKPLGDLFSNQPMFSGGSIMVDGQLALILDTNFLYNQVNQN